MQLTKKSSVTFLDDHTPNLAVMNLFAEQRAIPAHASGCIDFVCLTVPAFRTSTQNGHAS